MEDAVRDVRVFPDLEALSRAAAEELLTHAQGAVERRGRFALTLAGGRTPRRLYELLAGEYREKMPWERVHLFWGDERLVPPDHPESNYAMAYEALISQIEIPVENVHRVPVEPDPPERAAEAYERDLQTFFAGKTALFDVALLGVGVYGHTASLFPGNPVLKEHNHWVRAVLAPPEYAVRRRITLTLAALNRARAICFLAAGAEKRRVVREILDNPDEAERRYPAARVRPLERMIWYLDAAAAAGA
jgi:6-phosphogluconolactonase